MMTGNRIASMIAPVFAGVVLVPMVHAADVPRTLQLIALAGVAVNAGAIGFVFGCLLWDRPQ